MEKGGEIIFETGVDTKGLEQGLSEIKHETENLDDIVIDIDDDEMLEAMTDRLRELHLELKELESRKLIGDDERQRMKELKDEIIEIIDKANEMTGQNYVFKGITDADESVSSISNKLKSMHSSLETVSKKIGRIGLSMLGIRSIYGMISGSVSRVSQENEQIQTGIQAINNVLDNIIGRLLQALLPVINIIVKGITFVAEKLFGIDISSNQFSNNMKSANKSATKLRKQLLGFDEMNILNEDGSIGALSGGGGVATPSPTKDYGIYDDMSDFNKDLADLGYVAVYTGEDLKETRLQLENLIADVKLGNATMTEKNGIVTIMDKTGNTIKLTKKEYEKLLDDINHSRVTSRNLDLWRKVRQTFVDWNVKSFAKKYNSAVNLVKNGLKDATVTYENGMVKVKLATGETFTFTKEQWEKINEVANKNASGTKTGWIQAGKDIISKFTSDDKVGGVKGALLNAFWEIQNGGETSGDKTKTSWVQAGADIINKFTGEEGVEGAVTEAFDNLPESAKTNTNEAIGAVKGGVDQYNKNPSKANVEVQQDSKQNTTTVTNDIKNKMKNPFKATVQAVLDTTGMMKTLKAFAKSWPMAFQPIVSALQKQGYYAKGAILSFAKGGIINAPRLASGGIINRPGKGVPLAVGGAIGGERGREAVVPLTDTQQMQYLGREIAKNIIINLTNVTELDGRVLARSVSQVMSDMNFASNGGVI